MSKELQRGTHVNSQTGELVEADVDLTDLAERLVASATRARDRAHGAGTGC